MRPPRILCLETSGRIGSIALAEGPRCLEVRTFRTDVGHAAGLLPQLAELARRQGWPPEALDHVYLSIGPGSFTGLRIGWAVAKSLAHERDIPILAIPSLLAVARGAATRVGDGLVVACFDALRGDVFAAAYRLDHGAVAIVLEPGVWSPADLPRVVPERPRVTVGDDGLWKVRDRTLARRHRMSIGTIVSDADVAVRFLRGGQVGSVEESFIARLRPGDRFVFGGRSLEFVRVRDLAAWVRLAPATDGSIPRWAGGRMPLSGELAVAIRGRLGEASRGIFRGAEMRAIEPICATPM